MKQYLCHLRNRATIIIKELYAGFHLHFSLRLTVNFIRNHASSPRFVKAYIEAHGCALNRGEALEFSSILKSAGWDVVNIPEQADLNVIATCGVIETTEKRMLKRVKDISSIGKPLIVTGCMASALRSRIEPLAQNAIFVKPDGVNELCKVVGIAEQNDWRPEPQSDTFCHIIPIASGCQGDCSYCFTRGARGDLSSRPAANIIDEISRIDFSRGTVEIQLTAQDTASYGSDFGSDLPLLINELASQDFDMKIRIGMMNPRTVLPILDDLIDAYSSPNVYKFLHLPVQSASNRILKDMERGYTLDDFDFIVSRFKEKYPDMTLSTDLIVGYPDETKEDHIKNVQMLERIRPDIVNITRFSERPGTRDANHSKKIPGWITKTRSRELTRLRFEISTEKNRARIGSVLDVVVSEKGTNNTMIARTDNYKQVILPRSVDLGARVHARISDCSPIHLFGDII